MHGLRVAGPGVVRWAVPAVLLVALLSVSFGNGASRPLDGHEILVAETSSQMLARGDYLLPVFNERPRLQKPPLAYWLAAGVHALRSPDSSRVGEWEARLPALAAGGLLVLLCFAIARVAFGCERTALLAAGLLASSWDFFRYSRSARPEMLYACFCALLMLGLLLVLRDAGRGGARRGCWVAAAGLCGALLAKGPQLPLFFLAGTALAARFVARDRRALRALASGRLWIGLLPPLVYFVLVAREVDGAVAVWTREVLQDKASPLLLRPLRFYFPAATLSGFLPWIPLALVGAARCWRQRDHAPAAALWASLIVSLFFLGFSGKLRHHYVLPLLPLTAALSAWGLVGLWREARGGTQARRWLERLGRVQGGFLVAFWVGVAVFLLRTHPADGPSLLAAQLPFLVAAAGLCGWARHRTAARPVAGLVAVVLSTAVVWTGVAAVGGDVNLRWVRAERFAREVARAIAPARELRVDSSERQPFVYYGELRAIPWSVERLERAGEPIPTFLVTREPRLARIPDRVRVERVLAQPAGSRDAMILVRLAAATPEASPAGSDAAPVP